MKLDYVHHLLEDKMADVWNCFLYLKVAKELRTKDTMCATGKCNLFTYTCIRVTTLFLLVAIVGTQMIA